MKTASERVLQAVAVTAELTGTMLSEAAARVLCGDLAEFPEEQILGALSRCRKELRGRLTVAEIISRIDDGRPGAEEAWAYHVPKNESATVVWTEEIRAAWAIAYPLLKENDEIPARMAFKERYTAEVMKARDAHRVVQWTATLGHDPHQREGALLDAAEQGRLPLPYVQGLLSHVGTTDNLRLANLVARATEGKLLAAK